MNKTTSSKDMFRNLTFITMLFGAGSPVTLEPKNVFIYENGKFEMVCCLNEKIVSWNYLDKLKSTSPIHDGYLMEPGYASRGFRVESNESCSSLIHDKILLEHSGMYGCIGGTASWESIAHLVVFRTGGENCLSEYCNEHVKEKMTFNVSIQCSTIFSGLLDPVIKCKNGETELSKEIIQDDLSGMEKTVKNKLSMSIQGGSENVLVVCEIFFNVTDQDPLMAKNNHSWSKNFSVPEQCPPDATVTVNVTTASPENEIKWIIPVVAFFITLALVVAIATSIWLIRTYYIKKEIKPKTEEDRSLKVQLQNGEEKQVASNNGKSGEKTAVNA